MSTRLLVALLGREQRALRGEAVPLRGLALQRREVVQQRRALTLYTRAQLAHAAPAVAYALGDRDGRGLVREPRLGAPEPAPEVARASRGRLERAHRRSSTATGSKASISCSRRTISASVGVCTRPSVTTPPSARALTVAARVALMPTSQSASDRERAASSRGRSSAPGRRCPNASRIAFRVMDENHARSTGRSGGAASVEDVREDQLALAPGVAGVDEAVDVVATERAARIVFSCSLADAPSARGTTLEPLGHDRQVVQAPDLVAGVVVLGVGELGEVADGPGDHRVVAFEVRLLVREAAAEAPARRRRRPIASRR